MTSYETDMARLQAEATPASEQPQEGVKGHGVTREEMEGIAGPCPSCAKLREQRDSHRKALEKIAKQNCEVPALTASTLDAHAKEQEGAGPAEPCSHPSLTVGSDGRCECADCDHEPSDEEVNERMEPAESGERCYFCEKSWNLCDCRDGPQVEPAESGERGCPKCKKEGPHYVPPSLGEDGFYLCEFLKQDKDDEPAAPEQALAEELAAFLEASDEVAAEESTAPVMAPKCKECGKTMWPTVNNGNCPNGCNSEGLGPAEELGGEDYIGLGQNVYHRDGERDGKAAPALGLARRRRVGDIEIEKLPDWSGIWWRVYSPAGGTAPQEYVSDAVGEALWLAGGALVQPAAPEQEAPDEDNECPECGSLWGDCSHVAGGEDDECTHCDGVGCKACSVIYVEQEAEIAHLQAEVGKASDAVQAQAHRADALELQLTEERQKREQAEDGKAEATSAGVKLLERARGGEVEASACRDALEEERNLLQGEIKALESKLGQYEASAAQAHEDVRMMRARVERLVAGEADVEREGAADGDAATAEAGDGDQPAPSLRDQVWEWRRGRPGGVGCIPGYNDLVAIIDAHETAGADREAKVKALCDAGHEMCCRCDEQGWWPAEVERLPSPRPRRRGGK